MSSDRGNSNLCVFFDASRRLRPPLSSISAVSRPKTSGMIRIRTSMDSYPVVVVDFSKFSAKKRLKWTNVWKKKERKNVGEMCDDIS